MIKISKLKTETGAVIVEFALVSMLLLLILVGIMQFGLVFNTLLVLQDAARNVARSAAISTLPDSQIISNVISSIPSIPLSTSNIVITPSTRTRGQILTVTINYNYQMPVTLGILPASYPLTTRVSMLSEN
jgi:Flp pilus assembly protein TadG